MRTNGEGTKFFWKFCWKAIDRALGRQREEQRLILETTLGKQDVNGWTTLNCFRVGSKSKLL